MNDAIKHLRQLVGIAKTWALKNIPGWCDDTHRDLLQRHGAMLHDGRMSASTLNVTQLGAVLDDYERRGWPRKKQFMPKAGCVPRTVPPHIAHMVRLWARLGSAGKLSNVSRHALLAFCERQVSHDVHDLDSLTTDEAQRITEALKSWLAR
jgi:hypothetical protein